MAGSVIASSARLEELAAGFLQEHRPRGLAGISVGVVRDGELAWSAGCGLADVAAGRVPDETTLLRIASITKTFTGTAIMQLAGTGGLTSTTRRSGTCPSCARSAARSGRWRR